MKSLLVYTLLSEAKAAHSSPPEPNITPQFDLPTQAKVLNPDKIPFLYSPMIFPPHTYYLVLVRIVKNKKTREKFSCLAICLYVTKVVRLSRNCATQILNFIKFSDWFSRNYHAPATRQKILLYPPAGTNATPGCKWVTI